MNRILTRLVPATAALAVAFAACEQAATSPQAAGPELSPPRASHGTTGQADNEEFEVCKFGTTATFDFTVDDLDPADADFSGSFTLNDGECVVVTESGGLGDFVTVTERADPAIQLDDIVLTTVGSNTNATASVATRTASGTVSGSPGGFGGILAEFFNSPVVTGGEGCTPGYWRNHAGQQRRGNAPPQPNAWAPTGFDPSDTFDATFGVTSGFGPAYTLLDAVENPGEGEKVFAFHAVAALLNAAHPNVSYDLSVAEVISKVQGAYVSGDFEGVKDELAAFNEQGCPL